MNPELYVITDPDLSRGRSHIEVAELAIAGGATVIQLRDKKAHTRKLIEVGQALRDITRRSGVTFILNDRVDVALAVDADGVHLGEDDMPVSLARKLLGPNKILGASPENPDYARREEAAGADYLGIGSVFGTSTKPDAGPPIGLDALARVKRSVKIPVIAIGGVNASNAAQAILAGADGVAVISAVVGAQDITKAAQQLREIVREAKRLRDRSERMA